MKSKTVVGLIIVGTLVAIRLSAQTQQSQQPPEAARLIQSIQGPALFAAYCTVCHGKEGKGDGPMAKALKVAPPDLTHIATRNGGKFSLSHVQKIIMGEEQVPGGHGTREMPVWGPIFSQVAWDQDLGRVRADNLARYLESLQAK